MPLTSDLMPSWRSLTDAAKQTKVSKRTLQRWIKAGQLRPYKRMGDPKVYVDLDEIAKLREMRPRDEMP